MSEEKEPGLDLARLRSIGHLSKGRTMSRSKSGREHPDSGLPFKTTRDELGNDVIEHGKAGSGLSERQDVMIHPEVIETELRTEILWLGQTPASTRPSWARHSQ